MTTIDFLFWACMCGVIAAVYHGILIQPGKILGGLHTRLTNAIADLQRWNNYGKLSSAVDWLTKSLAECCYCLAGQLAILFYLHKGGRDPFDMILFIGVAIMASFVAFKPFSDGEKK